MKNGRLRKLVVLQFCQLSKSHGRSNQLSRASLQISIYAQMHALVVRTFQRSASFRGPQLFHHASGVSFSATLTYSDSNYTYFFCITC